MRPIWCASGSSVSTTHGLAGLEDAPRSGAPSRYTAENKARVVATARTRPSELGLPYGSWTFERLGSTICTRELGLHHEKDTHLRDFAG